VKKSTRIVGVVFWALLLSACPLQKEKVKPPVQPPVVPPPVVLTTLYVNAASGSDANSGAQTTPLKTLTKAMHLATSGSTIQVAPGLYDVAHNAETFPISLPGGVQLLGDEVNKGGGSSPTSIVGGGLAPGATAGTVGVTLLAGQGSTIAGFTITDDNSTFTERRGLILSNNTVTLRNNTVTGATQSVGVYVGASTGHVITGNKIVNNQGSGLGFIEGGAASKVENNAITGNSIGVKYVVAGGDLGGGSTGSAGGNVISCNTQDDLVASAATAITISAASDAWDHASPTLGCSAGDDVCDAHAGTGTAATFITTSATQASPHCGGSVLFVAESGLDTNPGTEVAPFKTITHALSIATSGSTVNVAPGTYDHDANGETFPIAVPDGVALIGDEANKGAGTVPTEIVGGGQAPSPFATGLGVAVFPGAGSTIAGFTVTNNNGGLTVRSGLILSNDGVTLRNNTVTGATQGIGVDIVASANHVITGNRIVDNGAGAGTGLRFFNDGGSGSKLENNVITGNGIGLDYEAAGGDLGGGSAGSAGGNVISCNTQIDLGTAVQTPITVSAQNNFWDHASPTVACDFSGGDICNYGPLLDPSFVSSVTIVTTGSAQTTNTVPCP
jgi:nitrous oxidase accessory protein NosD